MSLGNLSEWEQALLIAVAELREGEVVSYGDVAAAAGRPRAARSAGRFLSQGNVDVPWWRVVYADGRLPHCDPDYQTERLRSEGAEVVAGRVRRSPIGRFSKQ